MVNIDDHILFTFLDENIGKILVKAAAITSYRKDEVIFKENDPSDGVYLVLSGFVSIRKAGGKDGEKEIARVLENDYFGEFAVLDGKPRSASAVAGENRTIVGVISRDILLTAFRESGVDNLLKMVFHILRKIRENNDQMVEKQKEG